MSAAHLALVRTIEIERDNLAQIVDRQAETIDDLRRELWLAHMHGDLYEGIADALADNLLRDERHLQVAA